MIQSGLGNTLVIEQISRSRIHNFQPDCSSQEHIIRWVTALAPCRVSSALVPYKYGSMPPPSISEGRARQVAARGCWSTPSRVHPRTGITRDVAGMNKARAARCQGLRGVEGRGAIYALTSTTCLRVTSRHGGTKEEV